MLAKEFSQIFNKFFGTFESGKTASIRMNCKRLVSSPLTTYNYPSIPY